MKPKLSHLIVGLTLMLPGFLPEADACRRCRSVRVDRVATQSVAAAPVLQQQIITTQAVTVPFAIPVAVPVASAQVGMSYNYNYGYQAATGHQSYSALTTTELADRITAQVVQRLSQTDHLRSIGFKASAVMTRCAACHTGPNPKGGIDLSRLSPEKRYKSVRQVMTDQMPKGKTLTDEQRQEVLHELLELESAPTKSSWEPDQPSRHQLERQAQ